MQRDLYFAFDAIEEIQVTVPSTEDVGADTVEGDRGGGLQFSRRGLAAHIAVVFSDSPTKKGQ